MQPHDPILNADHEALETRGLADLLDMSVDYALIRPSLISALGVTEDDLREWERSSSVPPKIEAISFPDEDGDFDLAPPRGGETEFILDDPEEEDDEDEDSDESEDDEDDDSEGDESEDEDDDSEDEDDEGQDDPDSDEAEDLGDEDDGFDPEDVILEDDDGERD